MAGRLQNKVAIITGSSSGIGRATALAYAREGAIVICSDLQESPLNTRPESSDLTTTQELEKLGATTLFITCNTAIAQDVENLVKETVEKYGRLDVMVNNAGVGEPKPGPIWELSEQHFDLAINVNLKGVYLGTKFAAKQMISQEPFDETGDRGWIINLASILGLGGQIYTGAYVTSKHGVMGLTKTAAWDCAKWRVHVNAICPGYTATSMTKPILDDDVFRTQLEGRHPFRGLGTPEDVAKVAVFFASEGAGWVTGVGLPVDGGYRAT